MKNSDVIQLQNSQIVDVSKVAAKAFEDDPVLTYLISDDRESRLQSLTWLMDNAIAYCIQYNYVYTTHDLEGVAAWLPPENFFGDPLQLLKMALKLQLYALPSKVCWNRLGRWLTFLSTTEQAHQKDMGDCPHWYLGVMVVQPTSRECSDFCVNPDF